MSDTPNPPVPPEPKPEGTPPAPTDPPKPPDPPAPTPPPAPKPENEPVTRTEFNSVLEGISKLTETVSSLVEKIGNTNPIDNSKPVKVPWTHIGSKPRNTTDE